MSCDAYQYQPNCDVSKYGFRSLSWKLNAQCQSEKKKNHTLFGNHLPEYEVLKLSNLTKRRKKNVERFDR